MHILILSLFTSLISPPSQSCDGTIKDWHDYYFQVNEENEQLTALAYIQCHGVVARYRGTSTEQALLFAMLNDAFQRRTHYHKLATRAFMVYEGYKIEDPQSPLYSLRPYVTNVLRMRDEALTPNFAERVQQNRFQGWRVADLFRPFAENELGYGMDSWMRAVQLHFDQLGWHAREEQWTVEKNVRFRRDLPEVTLRIDGYWDMVDDRFRPRTLTIWEYGRQTFNFEAVVQYDGHTPEEIFQHIRVEDFNLDGTADLRLEHNGMGPIYIFYAAVKRFVPDEDLSRMPYLSVKEHPQEWWAYERNRWVVYEKFQSVYQVKMEIYYVDENTCELIGRMYDVERDEDSRGMEASPEVIECPPIPTIE